MNPKLQRAQDILRRLHLLNAVEQVRFRLQLLKNRRDNQQFQRQNPDFHLPPSHLAFDAHGHVNWRSYRESGIYVADHLAAVLQKYCVPANGASSLRILEWGCGPGRVIRHMPARLPQVEWYGSDYNPESVAWCQAHITGVTFVENELHPPLPFQDAFFDGVYAISVITHLSEPVSKAWISELLRVLKPGGVLVLWSNGDCIAERLLPEEQQQYRTGAFTERTQYEEGKKMYLSFHPPAWIRGSLLRDFEVLQHYPGGFSGSEQDVWVARSQRTGL